MLSAPSSRGLVALSWAFARKREPSFSSLVPNFADLQKGAPTTSSIAAYQFSAVILSVAKDPRICFCRCRCSCSCRYCCLFSVVILERSEESRICRRHCRRCLAVAVAIAFASASAFASHNFRSPQNSRHPERSCSRHFVSNAVEWTPAFRICLCHCLCFCICLAYLPLISKLSSS
jgi:hypothetical protein